MRARSPSPSAAHAAAAPKPAMPERFSVPARRPFCWPPPSSCGAKRRAVAHDQRADALRAAELVRRQRQVIAQREIQIDLARRRHRIDQQQRAGLARQRAKFRRSAGSRRFRCSRPSPRPGRGPCLRASATRSASRSITPSAVTGMIVERAARRCVRPARSAVARHRSMLDRGDKQARDARARLPPARLRPRRTAPAHWLRCRRW